MYPLSPDSSKFSLFFTDEVINLIAAIEPTINKEVDAMSESEEIRTWIKLGVYLACHNMNTVLELVKNETASGLIAKTKATDIV